MTDCKKGRLALDNSKVKLYIPIDFPVSSEFLINQIESNLIVDSLSIEDAASFIGVSVLKLKIQIDDGTNFPPHFVLPGSFVRHFPRTWIELWMKNQKTIHKI